MKRKHRTIAVSYGSSRTWSVFEVKEDSTVDFLLDCRFSVNPKEGDVFWSNEMKHNYMIISISREFKNVFVEEFKTC